MIFCSFTSSPGCPTNERFQQLSNPRRSLSPFFFWPACLCYASVCLMNGENSRAHQFSSCLPQPHRSPKINFPVDKRNPPPSDLSLHLFVLLVLHSLENTCITPSSHSRTKTASEPNDEEFPRNTEKKIHTESILVPLFILCVYFYTTFPGLVKQPNEGG